MDLRWEVQLKPHFVKTEVVCIIVKELGRDGLFPPSRELASREWYAFSHKSGSSMTITLIFLSRQHRPLFQKEKWNVYEWIHRSQWFTRPSVDKLRWQWLINPCQQYDVWGGWSGRGYHGRWCMYIKCFSLITYGIYLQYVTLKWMKCPSSILGVSG